MRRALTSAVRAGMPALLALFAMVRGGPAHAEDASFPRPPNLEAVRACFPLDEVAEGMLRRNGFVVLDGVAETRLFEAYPPTLGGRTTGLPCFITTDVVLHAWQGFYHRLLRDTETRVLLPRLKDSLAALGPAAEALCARTTDPAARAALREVRVTLAVTACLLDPRTAARADIRPEVQALAGKVLAHQESGAYPDEDFTMYAVRGHYAGSPELAAYFRASLWLSRRLAAVDRVPGRDPDAGLHRAVAMAAIVRDCPAGRTALARLNRVRAALTGTPNAISVEQAIGALTRVAGAKWSLVVAMEPAALAALRAELGRDCYPAADVHNRPTVPGVPFPSRIVSLAPGGALPDSVLFQKTLDLPGGAMPSGLEVAAALGSEAARREMASSSSGTAALLEAVERQGPRLRAGDDSVHGRWLQALAALFGQDPRAPEYMRGSAWQLEQVNTCLASWAQLRHAHILYGDQSMACGGGSAPPQTLVETNPRFFSAMAGLVERVSELLGTAGRLPEDEAKRLRSFGEECRLLSECAEAELAGGISEAQAQRISGFGDWLATYHLDADPLIADVATNGSARVLHVATGPLNPLVVIPRKGNGVAYVGWVASYYEVIRPDGARLNDAEWQALHRNTYLRPERPSWAREFAAVEGGAEWRSRAPLREAERLLATGSTDQALTLLRRVVEENRESPLATEAQCRLGRYYLERKEYDAAVTELGRCPRLPGCDVTGTAERLLRDALWGREAGRRPAKEAAERLKEMLAGLKVPGLSERGRRQREQEIARFFRTAMPGPSLPARLLREAAALCRTPRLREELQLRLLIDRAGISPYMTRLRVPPGTPQEALALSRRLTVAPFRAAALAVAILAGLHADHPDRAFTLLSPYLVPGRPPDPGAPPARDAPGMDESIEQQARGLLGSAARALANKLIPRAYYAGEFEAMLRYARALTTAQMVTIDRHAVEAHDAFPDFGRKPLALFARAEGIEASARQGPVGIPAAPARQAGSGKPDVGAAFLAVYTAYPKSKVAPFALWRAGQAYRAAGRAADAEKMAALLQSRYPGSPPGRLACAREAATRGDLPGAERILKQLESGRRGVSGASTALGGTSFYDIQHQVGNRRRLADAVRPVLEAAGRADLMGQVPFDTDYSGAAEILSRALPDRAAEIHLAMIRGGFAWLAPRMLERFPDHPACEDLRWQTIGRTPGGPRQSAGERLRAAAPYYNAGPSHPRYRDASRLAAHLVSEAQHDGTGAALHETAQMLRREFPGTPLSRMLDLRLAETLLRRHRPEEAAALLRPILAPGAMGGAPAGSPGSEGASAAPAAGRPSGEPEPPPLPDPALLLRRAQGEIAAKRRPEWRPLWTANPGGVATELPWTEPAMRGTAAPPVEVAGLLLLPAGKKQTVTGVAALDAETGVPWWTAPIGPVSGVCTDGSGLLFCGTDTSAVVALDAATGAVRYERVLDPNRRWTTRVGLAGGTLVVASQAGVVAGLTPATGEVRWRRELLPVPGEPAIIGAMLFVRCMDGKTRALDAGTGAVVWERGSQTPPRAAGPGEGERQDVPHAAQPIAVGHDGLLLAERSLYLLNAADGSVRQESERGPAHSRPPIVTGDRIAFWSEHSPDVEVHLVDASDLKKDAGTIGVPRLLSGFLFHDGVMYLSNDKSGRVEAIDLGTGALLACWPGTSYDDRMTVGRRLYRLSRTGQVVALPLQAPLDPAPGVR